MADGTSTGNGMLYFIVGGLCVVVAVGGFLLFGAGMPGAKTEAKTVNVNVELPKVEKK